MIKHLILLLFFGSTLFSQNLNSIIFNHPLKHRHHEKNIGHQISKAPITQLNVLAVMAEFAEDNDDRTSGNGKFDLSTPSKLYLDAPPHTKEYFRHHLDFVYDYFFKVSNGILTINTTLLDSVIQLDQPMKFYSPSKTSEKNTELGYLMRDVWNKVDSLSKIWDLVIPYKEYDAFIIFHAGVGRDIDLVSIYGYDPTPFDIPSIYIGIPALKIMFDDSEFPGIVINNGMDTIKNSLIIPETETRDEVPFPLGINGLLAANMGSHLGLPDLFDTRTGRSGIGRFGLMDGQAIFSWNGAFPPEPSAWEKYFLGWIEPITVKSTDSIYNFPAVSLTGSADTVIRVLHSGEEYYLIENRNRDANRDGVTVRMAVGSEIITKFWTRDTAGFTQDNQDSLVGVVISVDEYDWSLPGGYDQRKGTLYDGGILIWHVDERIINQNIATNRVNADEKRRGVDLEEADGSQDIGQSYNFLHPGSGSENGTIFDYWYRGNDAPLRRYDTTGFTPISYPNSLSNDLANSHIYISSFSNRAPIITARIQLGDNVVGLMEGFPKYVGHKFARNSLVCLNEPGIILACTESQVNDTGMLEKQKIFGWDYSGNPILSGGDPSGLIYESQFAANIFRGKLASNKFNNDDIPDITIGGEFVDPNSEPANPVILRSVKGWSLKDDDNNQSIDELFSFIVSEKITTSPVVSDSFIVYGASNGTLYFFTPGGELVDSIKVEVGDTSSVIAISLFENPSEFLVASENGTIALINRTGPSVFDKKTTQISGSKIKSLAAGYGSSKTGKIIAIVTEGKVLYCFDDDLNQIAGFPVFLYGESVSDPVIADIDGDGSRDIVVFCGNNIFAVNISGAMVDNFPISILDNTTFNSSPVVADIDADGKEDVIAVTAKGLVYAFDRNGRVINGFPLTTGVNEGFTPVVFYKADEINSSDICLVVASNDGYIYGWKVGNLSLISGIQPIISWPQYLHDERNANIINAPIDLKYRTDEFFPSSLAYNWPNPVTIDQGFVTYIRYYVRESARVTIKIFDSSGDLITQFPGPGIGGIENEIAWNAANINSGIYFAHVEAAGTNGANGSAIIKIAVIK